MRRDCCGAIGLLGVLLLSGLLEPLAPRAEAVSQRFKDQGLEILAISIDQENRHATVDYAAENRLPFTVLLDPDHEVMERYRVTAIPTHVLIDRQGRMRHRHVGPKDWRQPEAWGVLEPLLKEP